jgi:energy-coupling factor transport system permease protein
VWALCAGVAAMLTTNPFYLAPLAAGAGAVYATQRRPDLGKRSFIVFATFGAVALATRTLLVVFGPVGPSTVAAAALEGARVAVLLIVFGAFNSVTDPYRMLRLAPRRVHEPALAAALALSIAPRYIEAAARVREAQRLRGIDVHALRSLPALAVPVLETGMEEALTLAESMDARGHGRGPRSRYRPERLRPDSVATIVVSLSALAAFALVEGGDLEVATAPLRWPGASSAHTAAAVAFALPAFLPRRAT